MTCGFHQDGWGLQDLFGLPKLRFSGFAGMEGFKVMPSVGWKWVFLTTCSIITKARAPAGTLAFSF